MKLTQHFDLSEFIFSDYAIRHKLDNTPHSDVIKNLKRLAEKMEEVRVIVGRPLIVTSGYRSRLVNTGIGGSPTSDHMDGLACDFYPLGWRNRLLPVARKIASSLQDFDQLILEGSQKGIWQWIHLGIGEKMRGQVFTQVRGLPIVEGLVA